MKKERVTSRPILLIAAHGERGGSMANERLAQLASITASRLPECDVVHGLLSGTPTIEDAVDSHGNRPVLVFPFFMANGYFVDHSLAGRLREAGAEFALLPPLGTAPGFAEIAANAITSTADIPSGASGRSILVVAHGSTKDSRSRTATEEFAGRLSRTLGNSNVTCAYLEEHPFADGAVSALTGNELIVSLFAGDGLHAANDLPEILARHGFDDLPIITPASEQTAIAALITTAVQQKLQSSKAA